MNEVSLGTVKLYTKGDECKGDSQIFSFKNFIMHASSWSAILFLTDQYTRSYKYRMKAMDKMTELGLQNVPVFLFYFLLIPCHF